jgi:SAM-dependent methyltransferase
MRMLDKVRKLRRVARAQGVAEAARLLACRATGREYVAPNTVAANLEEWQHWDWSRQGEEWTISPEWKASVVECVLWPNIPAGCRVLEIGPGGGRWTEHLIERAGHVTAVDLTPRCIEVCRERFRDRNNVSFHVNDGRDLSFLARARSSASGPTTYSSTSPPRTWRIMCASFVTCWRPAAWPFFIMPRRGTSLAAGAAT